MGLTAADFSETSPISITETPQLPAGWVVTDSAWQPWASPLRRFSERAQWVPMR